MTPVVESIESPVGKPVALYVNVLFGAVVSGSLKCVARLIVAVETFV